MHLPGTFIWSDLYLQYIFYQFYIPRESTLWPSEVLLIFSVLEGFSQQNVSALYGLYDNSYCLNINLKACRDMNMRLWQCDWNDVLVFFFRPLRYSVLHNGKHTEQEKLSIQNDTESQESCFWHRPASNEEHHWKVPFLTALPAAQTRPEPFTGRGQGAGLNCLLKELLNNEGKGNVAKGIWSVF